MCSSVRFIESTETMEVQEERACQACNNGAGTTSWELRASALAAIPDDTMSIFKRLSSWGLSLSD